VLDVGRGIPALCRFGASTAFAASEVGRLRSLSPCVPFSVSPPGHKLCVHHGILSVSVVRHLRRREILCVVFFGRPVVVGVTGRARGRSWERMVVVVMGMQRKRGVETWGWHALRRTPEKARKEEECAQLSSPALGRM
jgi:hypothetical protein